MTKRTKKLIIIISACAVLAGLLGFLLYWFIPVAVPVDWDSIEPLSKKIKIVEESDGVKAVAKIDENGEIVDGDFKIIAFSDLHFDTWTKKTRVTMDTMISNIMREQPDMVIFVGDIITSSNNKGRLKQVCEVLEKLNVYWAPILGNHEGDNIRSVSRKEICEIYDSYPHCLMDAGVRKLADGTEVWGNGNYVVNIQKADGTVKQSLIFLDGGDRLSKEDAKKFGLDEEDYDYIKPSQINWYKETIAKLDEGVKSMMFVHIPLPEYTKAYEELGEDALIGVRFESEGASTYNSGMFDAIKEAGSTQAVIAGHDHVNDYRVLYDGVWLCYNRNSGYSSYNVVSKGLGDNLIQGCSIYTISDEGSITFGDVINADIYPQEEVVKLYKKK